jgi:hypothetical protein
MKIYNAYFEGLDGFSNTLNGANRVRAIEHPQLGVALDHLFAAVLERNEQGDVAGVQQDADYITDQLYRLVANIRRDNE